MLENIFTLANALALIAWAALIFIPKREYLYKFYFAIILPLLATIYGGLVYAYFTASGGSFGTIESVAALFKSNESLVVGWIHYLIFDLFVGLYIARDADSIKLPRLMQSIFLILTFMFGPIGLILYLTSKYLNTHAHRIIYYFHPENFRTDTNSKVYKIILYTLTFNLSLLPITLLALYLDTRTIDNVNVWIKPLKFIISISLHALTMLILLPLMRSEYLEDKKLKAIAYIGSYAFILEIIYISIQAARGRASHFNSLTAWENVLYYLMGVGATLGVLLSFYIGRCIYKYSKDNISIGIKLGSSLGLMIGSVLTFIVAGYMGSHNSHFMDVTLKNASSLPILGWSTIYGDLRVPHFFATHIMQALPLIGLVSIFFKRQKLIIYTASILLILLTAITFYQAINNIPFISL